MGYIVWSDELATGIDVIDGQHKRIISYINQLEDIRDSGSSTDVGDVLNELVDYTLSHFAFEESLMDEADYSASGIHKQTHESFRAKIREYQQRFQAGEDVSDELSNLLNVWLIGHIAEDDSSYVPSVKRNIVGINTIEKEGWLKRKIQQYFN